MRLTHLILSALVSWSLCASVAQAEELEMAKAPANLANLPARGMSMDKVEAAFGAPANRNAAIGTPPISRWEYPGFVVFFEHSHVVHTVAKG